MESLRKYLFAAFLIVGLASSAVAQTTLSARTLSLASPPNTLIYFANLTNPAIVPQSNGTHTYCQDCGIAPVCASGGMGASAVLIAGVWNCGNNAVSGTTPDPLSQNTVTSKGASPSVGPGYDLDGTISGVGRGMVSSTTISTATIAANSNAYSLGAAGDWANGQYYGLALAGATATIAAPTWCTTGTTGCTGHNYPFKTGSSASTMPYSYSVSTVDANMGISAGNATQTITNGTVMLGPLQWVQAEWLKVTGAQGYIFNGCRGVGCTPKFIQYVPDLAGAGQVFAGAVDVGRTYSAPELVGVGDGVTTSFTYTLKGHPLDAGSVGVTGSKDCIDNGSSAFTGTADCTNAGSSINYTTGVITVKFAAAPVANVNIWAVYTPTSSYPAKLSTASRDWVFGTVTSGAGTTSLVGSGTIPSTGVTGSVSMVHDNSTPLQLALNAAGAASAPLPAGGGVWVQRGTYSMPKPVTIPTNVTLKGDVGGTNYGSGASASGYVWSTTYQWTGPDGFDMFDLYDGLRQTIQGNFDARNVNAGASASTAMNCLHLDTTQTSAAGNDKAIIDRTTCNGAHVAYQIGGNVITDTGYPSGDISEFTFNQPHAVFPQTNDMRSTGYLLNSSNAGYPISTLNEPSCLGANNGPNDCIVQVSDGGLVILHASGATGQGVLPAFHTVDAPTVGTIAWTEEESSAGGYCLRVEPTASTPGGIYLGGVDFENNYCGASGNAITIDAGMTLFSKNNAPGVTNQTPTWQANATNAVIYSEGDGNAWTASVAGGTVEHVLVSQLDQANVADQFGRLIIQPSASQYGTYGENLRFIGPGTTLNWQCAADAMTPNHFKCTPSTANGGTTFTTPSLDLSAGLATVPVLGATPFLFANLAANLTANGQWGFCSDCKNRQDGATVGAACANSGTGAWAAREAGVNNCF